MRAIDYFIESYKEDDNHDGERMSASEQERYELKIINEARQIVAGKSLKLASIEHLRVVLSWLDCATSGEQGCEDQPAPF